MAPYKSISLTDSAPPEATATLLLDHRFESFPVAVTDPPLLIFRVPVTSIIMAPLAELPPFKLIEPPLFTFTVAVPLTVMLAVPPTVIGLLTLNVPAENVGLPEVTVNVPLLSDVAELEYVKFPALVIVPVLVKSVELLNDNVLPEVNEPELLITTALLNVKELDPVVLKVPPLSTVKVPPPVEALTVIEPARVTVAPVLTLNAEVLFKTKFPEEGANDPET